MIKFLLWLPKNLVGLLGMIQAIIKILKEIITVLLNILAQIVVIFPKVEPQKLESIIIKIRDFINIFDNWIQKGKDFLLKVGV